MSGRRRVDDDEVVAAGRAERGNLQERGDLVDARKRQAQQRCDVVFVEPRAAERDAFQRGTTFGQPAFERAPRVDFRGKERGAAAERDAAGRRSQAPAERIAERRRGIGGDDEGADAGGRARGGDGRGAGGLTDAAFAADEMEGRGGFGGASARPRRSGPGGR
jgi:hypothetical protein